MSPRHPPRAFTLIELLTVIAIIGILAGIVIGVGRRAGESGREARAKVELAAISTALESYKRQYGDYPRTGSAVNVVTDLDVLNEPASSNDAHGILFNALVGKRAASASLIAVNNRELVELGKFSLVNPEALPDSENTTQVVNAFTDPWGHRYLYFYKTNDSWTNPSFILFSVGPDEDATTTLPLSGYITPAYESATKVDDKGEEKQVNLDNIYANH